MKNVLFILIITIIGFYSCEKHEDSMMTSPCIEAKIDATKTANKPFTSIKRFNKNGESFWLFDTGSAFDAPQYMLNTACDTVCMWCFCPYQSLCQSTFNLSDSTAVVIWKP